jgi:hypothetical protein
VVAKLAAMVNHRSSLLNGCSMAATRSISNVLRVTVVAWREPGLMLVDKSVHAWLRRYREEGLRGLADRSHRPHHHPLHLAAGIEARVCELAPIPSPAVRAGRA